MRRLITLAVLAAAALTAVSPAAAITNGSADGNRHPNVGGLVSPTQYSDGTWLYCSGTLISPTVFLTALMGTVERRLRLDPPVGGLGGGRGGGEETEDERDQERVAHERAG